MSNNGNGYTPYSYIARVDGEPMEFVSPEEEQEYREGSESE